MVVNPLPIFPLETVLVPGGLLPLRVFEPRYMTLLSDVADNPEFGSVLIERGSEVGGGDSRLSVGTIGQIISLTQAPSHCEIVIVGTQRFTVTEWLEDAPYPRANVVVIEEPSSRPQDNDLVDEVKRRWDLINEQLLESRRVLLPPLDDLATDPALFSFQAAALAPMGPLDRYRIVQARTPGERLDQLIATLGDVVADLQQARRLD